MSYRNPNELLSLAQHMKGRMCYILIQGLRDPDLIVRRKDIDVSCDRLLIKMGKIGLLDSIKPGVWKINLPYLRKVSYVVTDELFDQISDPEFVYEQKRKLGKVRCSYEQYNETKERKRKESKIAREANRQKFKEPVPKDPLSLENIFFPGGEQE